MNIRLLWLALLLPACTARTEKPTLLDRLPLLPLPLRLDSTRRFAPVPFTRREVWNELLGPVAGFEEDTVNHFSFPVDSAAIHDYDQWNGLKLDQPLRRMPYYSPIFNGQLFVLGKVRLQGGLTAVLWGFDQNAPMYGAGLTYWLVFPDKQPGKAQYRTVYENLRVDIPSAPCIYTRSELRADGLRTIRTYTDKPWMLEPGAPPQATPSISVERRAYTIGADGLVPVR